MKFSQIVFVVFLSFIVAFATIKYSGVKSEAHVSRESAYDRVIRTGVLRCGYYVFSPVTMRDPNNGILSGLSVDMMNHIGDNSSLKIEWSEEVDFGNWMPGLKAGRFDAICTPMWPEPSLARDVLFTRPMFYAGLNMYARGNDRRFDSNLAAINSSDITIAVIEGNATAFLAQEVFPKAKLLQLPNNAPGGLMAESVSTKKADVLVWDENGVHDFLKSNPGGLHNVDPHHPIKVMPFELVTDGTEGRLRDLLSVALQSMDDTGFTGRLIEKWQRAPGDFYPMAKPYVMPAP